MPKDFIKFLDCVTQKKFKSITETEIVSVITLFYKVFKEFSFRKYFLIL